MSRRPTDAEQLARAHREVRELREQLARIETLRERMASFGSDDAARWAEVLGDVLRGPDEWMSE